MSDLTLIFSELSDAIRTYGCLSVIAPEVQAVIDRHDMLMIVGGDSFASHIDFGIRRGQEQIIGSFDIVPTSTEGTVCVSYLVEHVTSWKPHHHLHEAWNITLSTGGDVIDGDAPVPRFTILQ